MWCYQTPLTGPLVAASSHHFIHFGSASFSVFRHVASLCQCAAVVLLSSRWDDTSFASSARARGRLRRSQWQGAALPWAPALAFNRHCLIWTNSGHFCSINSGFVLAAWVWGFPSETESKARRKTAGSMCCSAAKPDVMSIAFPCWIIIEPRFPQMLVGLLGVDCARSRTVKTHFKWLILKADIYLVDWHIRWCCPLMPKWPHGAKRFHVLCFNHDINRTVINKYIK